MVQSGNMYTVDHQALSYVKVLSETHVLLLVTPRRQRPITMHKFLFPRTHSPDHDLRIRCVLKALYNLFAEVLLCRQCGHTIVDRREVVDINLK